MNTDVYTGADGAILLSAPPGKEGEAAQAVIDAQQLTTVGRVRDARVEVRSEIRAYHEIGQRYATQLRAGNVTVSGTFGRAYLNGALLGLLLGEASGTRPAANWMHPAFNVTLRIANPASGASNILTLHDVKLKSWVYTLPEDDFLMEQVDFQALYITVAEG
ncbi:hypothetical protein [Roseomonas sp. 18066]|uniref:hypothetical protein n=1 Tax=Roseomonas sp. 18066 TaxID=2681412 RepID=UPI00135C547A|nr:hypothetical protein [Roseomonas sp. 18066]